MLNAEMCEAAVVYIFFFIIFVGAVINQERLPGPNEVICANVGSRCVRV